MTVEYANLEAQSRAIFNAVHAIPASSADAVATLLMALADELKRRARQHRRTQKVEADAREHIRALQQIPVLIGERLNRGLSLDEANLDLCYSLRIPSQAIDYYWNKY